MSVRIATSRDSTVSNDGHVYWLDGSTDSGTNTNTITLPAGTIGLSTRPCMRVYRKRTYIAGAFSPMLVINENLEAAPIGIPAPTNGAPTVVPGTGSGGSEGVAICAVRFGQRIGSTVVAVGEPSAYAAAITLTGQGRAWSDLPTTCTNPSVNIIQGLVGMDGEPAAVAWTRPLGVTSLEENVLTGQLGELIPVKLLANGLVEVDRGALGVPPYCKFLEVYHDAMWYAGDPLHPERIYPSKLYTPEAVNTDSENATWLTTKDGLPVTGIHVWRDQLIVATPRSLQRIQGYSPDDYSIEIISTYTGCFSNDSMLTFGPQGDLIFASQDGINLYDGGIPRNLMRRDLRDYWRDLYLENKAGYEDSFAGYDRYFDVFMLHIPQADTTMFRFVGTMEPLLRGDYPEFVLDIRSRQDNAIGQFILPSSDFGFGLYVGSCDGNIRPENDPTNGDDDGDAYNKQFTIQTGAIFGENDQSGDDDHAVTWKELDLFMTNATTDVTVELYAGDETATDAAAPQWTRTVAAGEVTGQTLKTSFHETPSTVAGKSCTLRLEGAGSTDFSFRGFGLGYTPEGRQVRPRV